jgi:hypothetical protein
VYSKFDDYRHHHELYGVGLVTYSSSELLLELRISSTFVRTPWTGDQPDARPLLVQDSTTQKDEDKLLYLERDSNPQSQKLSGEAP